MKHILFLFNIFPGLGGLESVSNNIIDYLGPDNEIYTLSISKQKEVAASPYIRNTYQFATIADRQGCVDQLNRIIEEHHIDCIINQGIYPDLSDILFDPRRKQGVKVFSFLHGMAKYEEQLYWQNVACGGRLKLLKRRLFSRLGINRKHDRFVARYADSYTKACQASDRVVVLCHEEIEPFVREYGLEAYRKKVLSIENPLSVEFSQTGPIDWASKKNKIVYVGRLTPVKRVDILLDIWKSAQSATGDWELLVVGDGESREELEKMVRIKGIERVTFTGQQTTARPYYLQAKIILLTSILEGFPMCLVEALRFGVVPLSFDICPGVRSIVTGAGVLVPQDDRASMAARLIELIGDDRQLRSLSQQASMKSDRYTICEIGKHWEKLLHE